MQQQMAQRRVLTERATVAHLQRLLGGEIIVIIREARRKQLRVYTEPLRAQTERRVERELVLVGETQHVSSPTRRGRIITVATLDS